VNGNPIPPHPFFIFLFCELLVSDAILLVAEVVTKKTIAAVPAIVEK
jgi:hypothetical protein